MFTSQSGKGSECEGSDASVTASIPVDLRYSYRVIRYPKADFISDLSARARLSRVEMTGMQQNEKSTRRLRINAIGRLIFKFNKVLKPQDPFLSCSIEALLH